MPGKMSGAVCAECGARLSEGAERCELCGADVEQIQAEPIAATATMTPGEPPSGAGQVPNVLVCPECGRANRPVALFCDQCATPLAQAPNPSAAPIAAVRTAAVPRRSKERQVRTGKPEHAPEQADETGNPANADAKPRVGLLLIGGLVVVAVLYGITVISKSRPPAAPAGPPAQAQSTQPPSSDLDDYLPGDASLEAQADEIRSAVEATDDPAREITLRNDLVQLYASNGRVDLAGREQEVIAEMHKTAADWALAGNLHFDWMEGQSGAERVKAAQRAAAAYRRALEIEPDNLDVRTDLGVAYLNDPASPMLAIQETNAVIEADPNHMQANFNKGVMLLQIGRRDDAVTYFEKVLSLAEPGSDAHERATTILEQVRSDPS